MAIKGEHDGEDVDSLLQEGVNGLFPVQEALRHGRVKRQALTPFSGSDIQAIVDKLNEIRSNAVPSASGMEQLVSMYCTCRSGSRVINRGRGEDCKLIMV